MTDTEQRVLDATKRHLIERGGAEDVRVALEDAICQDLMIFGVDVEDYVAELEKEFGKVVWSIPWLHFTDQEGSYRGVRACLFIPFLIPWMILKKALWGSSSLKSTSPREHPHRITIAEIAEIIDAGGWQERGRPA